MATTEESALKYLNGERQPSPNRRAVPLAQAVAFQAGSEVQVGMSRENGQLQDFLGVHRLTEERANATMRTAGMRIGPGDLHASIGYYAAVDNTFIIAPEVQKAGVVSISSLETQFPGTVWV